MSTTAALPALPLASDADRMLVWAGMRFAQHTPQDDTYGLSCDERGCYYCNASSGDFVADAEMLLQDLADADSDPSGFASPVAWPDHDEVEEAIEEYEARREMA